MKIYFTRYIIYGKPWIKPHVFTSLKNAHMLVMNICPKGSLILFDYSDLEKDFKGKIDHYVKVTSFKKDKNKVELFIKKIKAW
jgi:hypothetical protein